MEHLLLSVLTTTVFGSKSSVTWYKLAKLARCQHGQVAWHPQKLWTKVHWLQCASTCSEDKHGLCQPQFVMCCKLFAKSITIQETFGARTCQFTNSAYVNCNQFVYCWVHAVYANIDTFQDVSVHLFNWTIRMELGVQNQPWITVL